MHHRIRLVCFEDLADAFGVGDVRPLKRVARIRGNIGEGMQVAGVGELVHTDDLRIRLLNQVSHQIRSDKTGPAGNEYFHLLLRLCPRRPCLCPDRRGFGCSSALSRHHIRTPSPPDTPPVYTARIGWKEG